MILAIDIGNTNIVIGCCNDNKICFVERISTNQKATILEYAVLLKNVLEFNKINSVDIEGAIISSVVPTITNTMSLAVKKIANIEALIVEPGIKTGLKILIDNPAQLGSDLAVASVACINEYPLPSAIIDMGTATTITVINKNGECIGGMIMPGFKISLDSLIGKTSQLPKICLEAPKKIIGSNTIDCMKSGMIYGTASCLDGMIDKIEEEIGESVTVIATGGLAEVVIPYCRHNMIIDNELLLKGLVIIYNKNN